MRCVCAGATCCFYRQVVVNYGLPGAWVSHATVTTETTLGSAEVGDGFMKKGGAFCNEAALAGKTPMLTIKASVAMSSIRLHSA